MSHRGKLLEEANESEWIRLAGLLANHFVYAELYGHLSDDPALRAAAQRRVDLMREYGDLMFFGLKHDQNIEVVSVVFGSGDIETLGEDWQICDEHRGLVRGCHVMGVHPAYFPQIPVLEKRT